jgi:hypothetical protein
MPWFMIPAGAAGGWSGQGCDPAEIQRLNRATWSRGLVPRPGPVAGHAALTKLMEDRVLVSEHIVMRSEAGHLQHRGSCPCHEERADVTLEPRHDPPARDRRASRSPMLAGSFSLRAGELRCHSGPGQPPCRALAS